MGNSFLVGFKIKNHFQYLPLVQAISVILEKIRFISSLILVVKVSIPAKWKIDYEPKWKQTNNKDYDY